MPLKISDEEFLSVCHTLQKPVAIAKHLGLHVRGVNSRMSRMESRGVRFHVDHPRSPRFLPDTNPARLCQSLDNGIILVGSDAHYFPGNITVAHKAFVKLAKELKPSIIVMNGDVFDGATISRWPRIGWDKKPTVKQELDACTDRLGEIEDSAPRALKVWPLGNHDARFETRLAAHASEYEGVKGFSLKEHFPAWKACWSFFVNDDTVIKHRFKGGVHATHNNTLMSGRTMVTGHLHSLKVTPFSDYNGVRWGVDTGTMADVYGEQTVDYTEDSPVNWRSGFAVLTVHNRKLLWPEVCYVDDGWAWFRGRRV